MFLDAVAGSITANSYASIVEANAWHASQLYGTAWEDVEDDQKAQALITATRILDENVEWAGWPTSYAQPLGWPRSGVTNRNGYQIINGTVPQALKNATAQLALDLITAGSLTNSDSELPAGLNKMKVGPIEFDFDPTLTSTTQATISVNIWSMISFLMENSRRSLINVNLVRM